MSQSRHTAAQMVAAVKQMVAGRKAEKITREVGVSVHTIYAWKSMYGGMDLSAELLWPVCAKPRFGYQRLHVLVEREGE